MTKNWGLLILQSRKPESKKNAKGRLICRRFRDFDLCIFAIYTLFSTLNLSVDEALVPFSAT